MCKKNIFRPLVIAAFLMLTGIAVKSFAQEKAIAAPDQNMPSLAAEERRFLINYLIRTRQMMHNAVRDVSAQQWIYKSKPYRWSIAECAEHIILTERWLITAFEQKFGKTAEPAFIFHWLTPKPKASDFKIVPLAERRALDLLILNNILDRSKVDTSVAKDPPPTVELVPTGRYKTKEEMLKDFDQQRAETLRILENSQTDWRQNYIYPGWRMYDVLLDGYQYLLRIPGHCERHLMQLEEVKRDANYPRAQTLK